MQLIFRHYVVYNRDMEMANCSLGPQTAAGWRVRQAEARDKPDIMLLLQNGRYTHIHLDWQPPADWVGRTGFAVIDREERTDKRPSGWREQRFGAPWWQTQKTQLAGCLAAIADPAPAAWVRTVALLEEKNGPLALLEQMLAWAIGRLRETAVTTLAWLVTNPWPISWLPALGFSQANEIVTYVKYGLNIPPFTPPPALHIRPAQPQDLDTLAAIEEAAFEPLWRHSAETLHLVYRQAFSFDVAEWNGRIVGFQFSTRSHNSAHLVRMTVLPQAQKSGIGSALLAHAIQGYQQHNLRYISLNTQADNFSSQKLYTKFDFQPQEQRLPVWVKPIN